MRVTVTGGTGFLGGFLVRDLLAKAVSVRVLARPSPRAEQLHTAGAEIIPGDINLADAIMAAVSGSDIVYHLAAQVGAAPRRRYFDTNVAGTERVLTACSQRHVKQFVYLSSLAVYGPVEEGERIDEYTPLDKNARLRDSYSESKIVADAMDGWLANLMANIKSGDLKTFNETKWDPRSWPAEAMGVGFMEAPRGALGHWIVIRNGKIANYQAVVPSTWNAGPRDPQGQEGAYEAALKGHVLYDPTKPIEILRTIHSFDPCLACAVHVVDPGGEELIRVKVR